MRPSLLRSLAALAVLLSFTAAARADLGEQIDAILADKIFAKSHVGVMVVRLGSTTQPAAEPVVLYEHNSHTPLIPASNLKLVTTSAILDKLGPEFKFQTLLVRHGDDIALIGDGDPSLGDAEMYKKVGWDVTTVFKAWADGLKNKQITTLKNVVVDDSVFEQNFVHPDWPENQLQRRYCAGVGGINLNANCLDFYIQLHDAGQPVGYVIDPPTNYAPVRNECVRGRESAIILTRLPADNDISLKGTAASNSTDPIWISIVDPPLFAGTVLWETFANDGIHLTGSVTRDRTLRAAMHDPAHASEFTLLAENDTPLPQVLARANKDSMNLYAECMCKRLGFAQTGQPGSWDNGTAAMAAFLKKTGADPEEFHLVDGCGLSKQNTISPNSLIHVLEYDFASPNRQVFMDSLAVGGVDGTLKSRFETPGLRGRVFAKSGYVNGVICLSGYLKGGDDQYYAFSILLNQVYGDAKTLEEKIVHAIAVSPTK